LDVIRRICRSLLEVTHERVDLDGLEAGDRDVEIFLNQEIGEFGKFDSQTLAVPTGVLGDLLSASISARFLTSLKPRSLMAGISSRPRSFAASKRPCPARSVEVSSMITGTVKPKASMLLAICSICFFECVCALRGLGLIAAGETYSMVRMSTSVVAKEEGAWS
jgi:hypothetical protein